MSGSRKDFLTQTAPLNYVAGLGRGATGFTTRSDLGPAKEGPSDQQLQENIAKRAAALGQVAPAAYGGTKRKADDEEEEQFQNAENEEGLLAHGNFDRDDDEADRLYQAVDDRMSRRRKRLREERERREREEYERKNPKIQQQFAELKRALGTVQDEDWANLPDAGDHTGKNRRAKQNMKQRFYAVPDSVLTGARDLGKMGTEIQDNGAADATGDLEDQPADGTSTNFANMGAARDRVLKVRLDQAAQTQPVGGDVANGTSTNFDTKGYLSSLDQNFQAGLENVGDIKRARQLLESVIKTNPKHAPGWIAAARLEEYAGKIVAARNVMKRGCEHCPKSEDAWMENIRLNAEGSNQNARIVAAKAIENNNQSIRLWVEAMKLEPLAASKKRVLRKALDHIPESVTLWKEAVNLEEDPADARLLLAKAVELIPPAVELWLALARLETPDQAQIVLNKARKACPRSVEVWIAAARLREQIGETNSILKVMERGAKNLAGLNAMGKREQWIAHAETCEAEGATYTCRAIIRVGIKIGLEDSDYRKDRWLEDAERSTNRERYETARSIYAVALGEFYHRAEVWEAAIKLERDHGTKERLIDTLADAVTSVPHSTQLWLIYAKELWQSGDILGARELLTRAFAANSGSEDIYLAAVKLEADNNESNRARQLFAQARKAARTDRVWVRSVAYERQLGNIDGALALVNEALQIFPNAPRTDKLWMMKGQIYEQKEMIPQAREAYNSGTRACPSSIPLWLLFSRLEERAGILVKARSVLDRARIALPKSPEIWAETIRLELRANNTSAANQKMSQALQACPNSGLVWNERIWHLEARTQRKPRLLEAIQKSSSDADLFVSAAKLFWMERKLDKAHSWFTKAANQRPLDGDIWAWYYKFLLQHGTEEKREEVMDTCIKYDPKYGEVWAGVRKDPKNSGKSTKEILIQVVGMLRLEGERER